VEKVLEVYKLLSSRELVISSNLKGVHPSITLRLQDTPKTEVMKAIEKALLEQAGVVITPLDDKRISVTFNDALPLTPAKKLNPNFNATAPKRGRRGPDVRGA
jgi:hypothetical protein